MNISEFDYHLPKDLIAQEPPAQRGQSKLLYLNPDSRQIEQRSFDKIAELLRPGDLIVANDTRVLPARLFATKPTGGKVEIMLERIQGAHTALVQLRSNKPFEDRAATSYRGSSCTYYRTTGRFFLLHFDDNFQAQQVFERLGKHAVAPVYSANVFRG